ncbi:hypothetical protein [Anaerobiospirillum succiniciproducens]|uniref:hypothetical protein n=1 Tax=Anaerobiospirillum succiniciproducens TaxID=13335 RepID=UPI0029430F82|nr:hypothetical protein [Anaerobiospirillum succiniciproducens]
MLDKYTFDVDLDPVLQAALQEELDVIIRLMKASDDLKSIEKEQLFMRHYPNHRHYTHLISAQLRTCGGHAVANLLRGGKGPDYRTVVCDVADHLNVSYDKDDSVPVIERCILMSMTKKIYDDLGDKERDLLINSLSEQEAKAGIKTEDSKDEISKSNTAIAVPQSRELVLKAVQQGDYRLLSTNSLLMLSEALSTIFSSLAGVAQNSIVNATDSVSRAAYELAHAISSGLDVVKRVLLSLLEIGGPSYKVTVPCVTQIASMRLRQSNALLTKSSVNLLSHNAHEDEAVSNDKSAEANETAADSSTTNEDPDSSKEERN